MSAAASGRVGVAAKEPTRKPPSTRPGRDIPVPADFDVEPFISSIGSQLAGPANVIMQLSWPGVGYGVMNSRVHDGSAMLHPIKRARTTFTYLAVALLGNDEERAAFRRAVNGQHAQVVSQPDEPVGYRAMDPQLQRWVAACLYYGTRDMIDKLRGRPDEATADALYAHCARFGTTLQMPAEAWPESREAFDEYWEHSLADVRIDPQVRDYLLRLTMLQNLHKPIRRFAAFNLFVTTGFLPPFFREQMGLPWSQAHQRRFDRLMRRTGRLERVLPVSVRTWPFRALLGDMRRRRRKDKPLV